MASTTLTVIIPSLAGTTVTATGGTTASSETVTIRASTASSALDFGRLFIRIYNQSSTASIYFTLAAGTIYSEIGQGAKTSTTIGTEGTLIIGGQDFESARFLNTAGTIIFTQVGTGPSTFEAFQYPKVSE
jgi:hypothetical protein